MHLHCCRAAQCGLADTFAFFLKFIGYLHIEAIIYVRSYNCIATALLLHVEVVFCIVLYCIVLYCIVSCRIVSYRIVQRSESGELAIR